MAQRERGRRNPEIWLTPREISELLDFHYLTILNWIHHDGLRTYATKGGYFRIRKSDLRNFLDVYYPDLADKI